MRKIIILVSLFLLSLSPLATAQEKPTVLVFVSSHCKFCFEVKRDVLPELKEKYQGKVDWLEADIAEAESLEMLQSISEQFSQKEVLVPSIFFNNNLLVGSEEIKAELDGLIKQALLAGAEEVNLPESNLVEAFKKFSLLAILGSGLADGVNPCAFAVIVFFVSFLSVYGYKKREIIYVGAAYCLAVFITYLLIGLGFFQVFYSLANIPFFIKWFYYFVGIFCLIMGLLALYDWISFRITKKSQGAILQLPQSLKKKINLTIGSRLRGKKEANPWGLAFTSFSIGFMVSLLEAACTGQLYVPTIVFVLKSDQLRLRAWLYLLLYNLMFILPLLAVFLLSFLGVSSNKFNNFLRRNAGIIKLIMALVFFVIGGFLLSFS